MYALHIALQQLLKHGSEWTARYKVGCSMDRAGTGAASCFITGPDVPRLLSREMPLCNRADLMYGIMAVHEGHAYIGMVEGLPREISEVIHHTDGCIGR